MKLIDILLTLKEARKYEDFPIFEELVFEEIEDLYFQAKEVLFDNLTPKLLDKDCVQGTSTSVSVALPKSVVTSNGDFNYDRENDMFDVIFQDIDGLLYRARWKGIHNQEKRKR